jgi:hypothetical protein
MPNFIRTKQIDQVDLSGFVVNTIPAQSGIILNYVSGVLLKETVLLTGNQTVSGIKSFPQGINVPNLAYTTGNQTISGAKTFERINIKAADGQLVGYISGVSNFGSYQKLIINGDGGSDEQNVIIQSAGNSITFGEGNFIITNDNGGLNFNSPSNDNIYINNTRNLYADNITASFKNISAQTGTFQKLFATNLVYNTGDQTISGVKNFVSRPMLNGTGLLLSGDTLIVYNTGNQTISGIKAFISRPTVNGTGVLLSGEATKLPETIVYTTGNQTISGIKSFISGNFDDLTLNFSDLGDAKIKFGNVGNLSCNGGDPIYTFGGNTPITIDPYNGAISLNGLSFYPAPYNLYTYFGYSGEYVDFAFNGKSIQFYDYNSTLDYVEGNTIYYFKSGVSGSIPVDSEVVHKTGNETISGNKTFISNIDVSGTVNLNSVDMISLSGVDILLTSGTLTLTNSFYAPNLVYNTGFQDISGSKTFRDNVSFAGQLEQTILLGLGTSADNATRIGIPTGFSPTVSITRGGLSPVAHGYGIVFAGGPLGTKKGYLTSALGGTTRIPTGYQYATLDWTNRILSGDWSCDKNIKVGDAYSVLTTGDQTIFGVKTFFDSGIFSNGGVSAVPLLNNPLSIVGSGNNYVQLNIQNRATGLTATADLVITANNGTDNSNFINLGINNSGYSDPLFNNTTGLDGYLIMDGGDLDIGTRTPGKIIEFHAGGTTEANVIAKISQSGLNIVSGNLTVNNTGVLLSGSTPFTMNFGHKQNNPATGPLYQYFGPQMDIDPVSLANNEKRRVQIMQDCYLRKVVWTSIAKSAAPTPTNGMTGYFKNFGNNPLTDDQTAGVQVTSGINIPASNTMYANSTGTLNIPIKSGDYISFYYQSNFSAAPTNLAVNVDGYFYV